MMARFLWYFDPLSLIIWKKTLSELDPLWQKFLDPRMDLILVFKFTSELNMLNVSAYGWRHLNNTSVSNVHNYII